MSFWFSFDGQFGEFFFWGVCVGVCVSVCTRELHVFLQSTQLGYFRK